MGLETLWESPASQSVKKMLLDNRRRVREGGHELVHAGGIEELFRFDDHLEFYFHRVRHDDGLEGIEPVDVEAITRGKRGRIETEGAANVFRHPCAKDSAIDIVLNRLHGAPHRVASE